jgi:hypothetical protein
MCAAATTLSPLAALVAVSNGALFLSLVMLSHYVLVRRDGSASRSTQGASLSGCPASNARQRGTEASVAVMAMALFPTTLFFHMAYSESLFLMLSLVSMCCIEQRRPVVVTAVVIGVATAVRPVGVALLVPFVLDGLSGNRRRKLLTILVLPISIGGLLGYMWYQLSAFGDALAFAKTQANWKMQPPLPLAERALALFLWQPIVSVYSPSSPSYWDNFRPSHALLNWQFANPIYFGLAAMLLVLGAARRWLNARETGLGIALLAIPYLTRAYEMGMNSQARFASVVFPVYIVLGRVLASASWGLRAAVLTVFGSLLLVYCVLFAARYPIF